MESVCEDKIKLVENEDLKGKKMKAYIYNTNKYMHMRNYRSKDTKPAGRCKINLF